MNIPPHLHNEPLTTLNGIKFTHREIDIIALIFHTRGSSKIARLLSISTRTVETHTANIMRKMDTNSREGIIDFVEKSGHAPWIHRHYRNLFSQMEFKKQVREISRLTGSQGFICSLIVGHEHEEGPPFVSALKEHLSLCGIKVLSGRENQQKPDAGSQEHQNMPRVNHTLYIVPKTLMDTWQTDKEGFLSGISQLAEKNAPSSPPFTFILHDQTRPKIPQDLGEQESFITFGSQESYYPSFLDLLKRMLPDVIPDKLIEEFKSKHEPEHDTFEMGSSTPQSDSAVSTNEGLTSPNRARYFVFSAILFLTCLVAGLFIVKGNRFNHNNQSGTTLTASIRSDLLIPSGNTFLARPHILSKIAQSLKDNAGIQTVALVGIGGAGKTTIARQYALQQNANIVWEINTATRESLRDSFERLAYALCQSEEEKTILAGLRKIKNNLEKEQKVLLFVKERMKRISNWFLIYDNVDKFTDIYNFFPCDSTVWGNGKVIVTTNNSNTINNNIINNFVQIGELTPQEKLDLFARIMNDENFQGLTSNQAETNAFLSDVPPYPLDISIAAYYLKSTNTPYKQYLEMLKENRKDFDTIQADVLKEASGYTKTRYGIITLSVKELITIHKDFQDLLLLISLINYQNIPKSLLIQYKGNTITDNFIYHLKKYSLITNESFSSSIPTISIHKKTQEIILSSLTNTLTLSDRSPLLNSITAIVEDYILDAVDKEDFSRMKLLASHGETLLSRQDLLTDATKSSLRGALGCIYYYLKHYPKIKQFLEENLADLKDCYGEKHDKIARTLLYLGNFYRSLGNYEKAKTLLEQSLVICEENPHYLRSAKALGYLGAVYRDLGEYKKARGFFEQSLVIYEKHSPHSIGHAWILTHLGNIHRTLGDYGKAKVFLEQSLSIYKKQSEDYVGTAWTLGYLGTVHRLLGDYKTARNFIEKALSITKKYFSEDHIYVNSLTFALANVYIDTGDFQTAKKLLKNSLTVYQENYGQNHIETANVLRMLGKAYRLEGDLEASEELLNESLLICQQKHNPSSFKCLESLADLYVEKETQAMSEGDTKEGQHCKSRAIHYLRQSLQTIKDYFGEDSPHGTKIQLKLDALLKPRE